MQHTVDQIQEAVLENTAFSPQSEPQRRRHTVTAEYCVEVADRAVAATANIIPLASRAMKLQQGVKRLLDDLQSMGSHSGIEEIFLYAKLEASTLKDARVHASWHLDGCLEPISFKGELQRLVDDSLARAQLKHATAQNLDNLLVSAHELFRAGHEEAAIDLIYDEVDALLVRGRFAFCDVLLLQSDVLVLPTPLLLSILTVTHPAKSRLSYRAEFFRRVQTEFLKRHADAPEILIGLE